MVAIIIHRSEQNANSPNHYSGSLFSSIHQTLGSTLAGKIVHMYSRHKNVSWRKALSERNQNSQFPRSLFSKPESTVCQKCADPLTLSWILASFRSDIPITSKFQESVPNPHDFEIYFFLQRPEKFQFNLHHAWRKACPQNSQHCHQLHTRCSPSLWWSHGLHGTSQNLEIE